MKFKSKFLFFSGPLHKVLHLYAILGNLNSYHDSYRNGRDLALRNIMQQVSLSALSISITCFK